MIGTPSRRIVLRHVLPNCLAPVIVSVSFSIPSYILAEASLMIAFDGDGDGLRSTPKAVGIASAPPGRVRDRA